MNTCKDCKYWRGGGYVNVAMPVQESLPPEERSGEKIEPRHEIVRVYEDNERNRYRKHQALARENKSDEKFGICLNPLIFSDNLHESEGRESIYDSNGQEMDFPSSSIYSQADDNRGFIAIGRDFGCIHWEQKA